MYQLTLLESKFSEDESFIAGILHPYLSVVVLYENIIVVLNEPVYIKPVPTMTDTQIF